MIGAKLIRKQLDMSLNDLAKVLGISNQFISKWENGDKQIPIQRLQMLSSVFKVPQEILQKDLGTVKSITVTTTSGDTVNLSFNDIKF